MIKTWRKDLERMLRQLTYTGTGLSSQFNNVKQVTPFEEQHDVVRL